MKKLLKKKFIILLAIIVVVIVILMIFAKQKLSPTLEESNAIQLEKVQKRDLSDFISLSGTISGESSMNYSSSAAAEILTLNVAVGDEVKEEDVIATLDKEENTIGQQIVFNGENGYSCNFTVVGVYEYSAAIFGKQDTSIRRKTD